MKLITTLCFSFFLGAASFSQEIDQRLLSKYTSTELNEMMESSPKEYALLDYALDNAIYFSKGIGEKTLEKIKDLLSNEVKNNNG